MVSRIHQEGLPRFLLLSVILHLIFLAGFGMSTDIITTRYLGQPVLNVQLPNAAKEQGSPFSKSTASASSSHLVSERAISDPRSPSRVAEYAPDPLPTAILSSHAGNRHKESADEAGARNQLLGQLQTRLSRYLVYPPLARHRGWEGTVLLGLSVEPDGQLGKIHITRSSGYAVLDNSALNSLKRIGILVEARNWLEGRSVDLQLPVIYRLIEN